jgi:hypothetical protein
MSSTPYDPSLFSEDGTILPPILPEADVSAGTEALDPIDRRDFIDQRFDRDPWGREATLPTLPLAVSRQFIAAVDDKGIYRVGAVGEVRAGDHVQLDRATVICADRIVVSGVVRTHGCGLTLVARELHFEAGAALDTSGRPSTVDFSTVGPPATPSGYGRSGLSGMSGGHGESAGGILVIAQRITGPARFLARGGNGGTPQNGGSGRDGQPGANGSDSGVEDWTDSGSPPTPPIIHGGPGGDGGDAGMPGARGRGGDGGTVTIRTLEPLAKPAVMQTEHGRHGAPGRRGAPGGRGPGGKPGIFRYRYCQRVAVGPDAVGNDLEIGSYLECGDVQKEEGNEGDWGDAGRTFDQTVAELQKEPIASNGNQAETVLPQPQFARQVPAELVEMLAWEVEDAYRRSGGLVTPEIAARLQFLLAACVDDPQPGPVKAEVEARVHLLCRKIALGLDYYGYSLIDVPILSFETYSQQVGTDLLQNLNALETATERYEQAKGQREAYIAAARSAVAGARPNLTAFGQQLDLAIHQSQALADDIPQCEAQVIRCIATLEQARDALNDAISARSGHKDCNLQSVILAAVSIYVIVQSAGAASAALGKVGGSLAKIKGFFDANNTLKKLWDNKKVLDNALKELGEIKDTVQDSINKIRDNVSKLTPSPTQLPSFQMEKAQFDKVASQFADYPQAAAYREAGYAFLQAVAARNQAIVDFNASLLRVSELQLALMAMQRIVDGVESRLKQAANPGFDHIYRMMRTLYADALSNTAASVHRERKALGYSLNKPMRLEISELNASTIGTAHAQTMREWQRQREQFNPRLTLNAPKMELNVFDLIDGDGCVAWEAFKQTGKLEFVIRIDHPKLGYKFRNMPALRLTGIQFVIEGARFRSNAPVPPGEDQLFWDVTLNGLEDALDKAGNRLQFRHKPLTIPGACSTGGMPGGQIIFSEFGNEGVYAGFSPFTHWQLAFRTPEYLDFSDVTKLRLFLGGYSG